ncbi:MAG: anaerobic glycerol-3-phosphate dehydrogenase subunit GlpA [Terracidiphilus sp.]|nr:anaerobic glycerol-3-phosphate dehydrogenase subunit GlpA [Terracidiphilus sp.]
MESTQVVIIGGGATGAGILWDLTLRGIPALLLEQADIANGATGRCHGLLHSGGRYVVKDLETARDCLRENRIVKQIAPHCVEDTGGLFVQLPEDDPAFFERWWRAANEAEIPSRRLSAEGARALEPNLPETILGAFTCPDAHVDVFRLVLANIDAALARGAQFRSYARVTGIDVVDGRVRAVNYLDTRTNESHTVACEFVVNAAGGWAQNVAALAGVHAPVCCDKGTLLVINHRLTHRVVNRCRVPGDADILVPAGPVCLLGTSSMVVPAPDGLTASSEEIDVLLRTGGQMISGLAEARVLRTFSGVRALYAPESAHAGGRGASRSFALLDHEELDGVAGFLSIVGGKLTTYRHMAAAVADCIAQKLDMRVACATATTPLRAVPDNALHRRALRVLERPVADNLLNRRGLQAEQILASIEAHPALAELVCECEMVTRAEVNFVLAGAIPAPAVTIADVGRRTRLGFGPCQGTYCGFKAMLAGFQAHRWDAPQAANEFSDYVQERWKGQSFLHEGKQLEQLGFSHELYGDELAFNADAGVSHDK